MSIDQRGRNAGAQLRLLNDELVDVDTSLDHLMGLVRRRQRMRAAGAVAAAIAVVVGLGLAVDSVRDRADSGPTTTVPTNSLKTSDSICQPPLVTCIPGGGVRMAMSAPMTWNTHGPDPRFSYKTDQTGSRLLMVESRRAGRPGDWVDTGVTVLEDVQAVQATRRFPPDLSVQTGAQPLAAWLAQRSFLDSSAVTESRVDGRPAWRVQVRLSNPDHQGVTTCYMGVFRCMPVLSVIDNPGVKVGIWNQMLSRFTFVDVPAAGTTVIWTWSFGGPEPLTEYQTLIDTVTFETP